MRSLKVTRLTPDSISGISPDGQTSQIPLENVSGITVVNRGAGAIKGFAFGLLGGAVTGLILAAANNEDSENEIVEELEEGFEIIGVIVYGGLGGLIGIPVGAATGDRQTYQIIRADATVSPQNSPTQSPRGNSF